MSFAYKVSTTTAGAEIKWNANNATYYINTSEGPSGSLAAVQAAMQTWTDVSTSPFNFNYGGTTSSTAYGTNDGVNIVCFGSMNTTGLVGQNKTVFYVSSGYLIDSDVKFNTDYQWVTDGSANGYDVQNVATHELGHSLSLEDLYSNADTEKTMYGYTSYGETIRRTLAQDDIDGITYLYPNITCTYSISPTSQSPGSSGGSGNINVTAGSNCSWIAVSNSSWITITSGSSGTGNGTVYYTVGSNTSGSSRTGTISIHGDKEYIFTVTQSAPTPTPTPITCTYSISPTSQSLGSSGGSGNINITADSNCSWIAVSNNSWITITSGSSGNGNGTVYYTVGSNTSGSLRTGTISIHGDKEYIFTVTQSTPTPTPSSTPSPSDTAAPTNGSISINSGASYTNSTAVTLTLSATDTVGVTGYYLSTSSSTPSSSASGWTSVSSTTSYSGSVSYTFTSGDETKTVYVWYKDAAGNVSSTASDSIILDTTAPIATITSPTSSDTYTTTSSTINLSGSASDGSSGVKEVTWSNDKGGSGNANGTTSWNISSVSLSSGDNKITVTAKDNAGNASTDTITVTYSTPTPTPTTTPTTCTDSYEPNNSTSEAYGPLSSGSSYSGKICSDSDEDWFKANITSIGTISLSLTVPSNNDYDLKLYDSSNTEIASSVNGSGVSESISYNATATGIYYIKIYGFSGSSNTTSSYTLTYTYTSTPTPTATPTPTTTPPGTGVILGTVVDVGSASPIAGATVSTDTGGYTGTTGPDGSYTMSDVETGTYTLTASATGYNSSSQSVTVSADELTSVSFALSPTAIPTPTVCWPESVLVSPASSLKLTRETSEDVTVTVNGDTCDVVAGETVTATINAAGKKRISISPTSMSTDENGQATFTITAKKKTGNAKVTFKAEDVKKSITVKVRM